MAAFSSLSWFIADFANTILLFTLVFLIFPRAATKFNLIFLVVVIFLVSYVDYHFDISEIASVLLYFVMVRNEKVKLIEKILVMAYAFFSCTISFSVGFYVVYDVLNFPEQSYGLVGFELVMIALAISYFLSLSVYYLGKKLIEKLQLEYIVHDSAIESVILIALVILIASNFTLNFVSKHLDIQRTYLLIILSTTLFTLAFIGIGMIVFILGHLSKVKADYELQQINERNAYINGLENKNSELRRFKHDYKNFLLSLSVSIENNQDDSEIVQRLLNYADVNLKNDTKLNDANLYKINDKLIRGIIITKIMIARDKGVQTNVEIDKDIEISKRTSVDITRILGILFDNAIEASLKNPKPELDFALISYDESIEFVFKNNVDPSLKIEMNKIYNNGYSTKSDHNGLGLATVKQIVNSNKNFLLQTKFENAEFSTVLTSIKIN